MVIEFLRISRMSLAAESAPVAAFGVEHVLASLIFGIFGSRLLPEISDTRAYD